jgi:hypothetical protein
VVQTAVAARCWAVLCRLSAARSRRRSWRVEVLQNRIDAMLALSESRAAMYADEMDGGHEFQVTLAVERKAIAEGCRVVPRIEPPPELPDDWKDMPPPNTGRRNIPRPCCIPGIQTAEW